MAQIGWVKSGEPWVWMLSSAVSLCLITIFGLLLLITFNGLSYFWPSPIYQWQLLDASGNKKTIIGQLYDQQEIKETQVLAYEKIKDEYVTRFLVRTSESEQLNSNFYWLLSSQVISRISPKNLVSIKNENYDITYGYLIAVIDNNQEIHFKNLNKIISNWFDLNKILLKKERVIRGEIETINNHIASLNVNKQTLTELIDNRKKLISHHQLLEQQLRAIRSKFTRHSIIIQDANGTNTSLNLANIYSIEYPNQMNVFNKFVYWLQGVIQFISDVPKASNMEGGVWPAIFGTVLMVLLMTIIVTPFGVIAAVYLHEYAKAGLMTRIIRVAVINLAGVPSIVYGIFGLGFFVYIIGGSIDQLFYSEALPSATFGTPGLLWSSLTLATLTLPVVIVTTEEGLARIPNKVRQGSLALGATKMETLWHVVLPMASPAIMTGAILALARAAGEVAPLMLVGVVKLAPSLPMDWDFPFIHLERKFMHLGFHIYDVAFQSPNIEAARPLVYATSLLLIIVIVSLNLTFITVRNRLREKNRILDN